MKRVTPSLPQPQGQGSVFRSGLWTVITNLGSKLQAVTLLGAAAAADGGIAGVGVVSALYAVMVLGASCADFGYSSEVCRYVAANPTRQAISLALSGIRRRSLVSALFGFIAGYLSLSSFNVSNVFILIASLGSAAYLNTLVLTQVLYGLRLFKFVSVTVGVVRLLGSALLLLGSFAGLPGVAISLLLIELAVPVAIFLAIRTRVVGNATDKSGKPSNAFVWLGVGNTVNALLNRSDTALISVFSSASTVGLYSIASQAENAVTTLALTPAAPTQAHIAAERMVPAKEVRLTLRIALFVAVLSLFGSTLLVVIYFAVLANGLVKDLVPQPEIGPILVVVLAAAPASSAAAVFLMAMAGRGHHIGVAFSWLSAAIVSVPVLVCATISFGAVGAAVGSATRDISLIVASVAFWKRSFRVKKETACSSASEVRHE